MIKRVGWNLGLIFCFMIGFVGSAFAAGVVSPDPDGSLLAFAGPILDSIKNGQGWIAAALALILASAAARRYLAPKFAFFGTAIGALLIVFTGSYGAAVLTGLAAAGTTSLTMSLAYAALKVAIVAAGGFAVLRPLLVDVIEPFVIARFPWISPLFDLVTWAFDKPSPVLTATAAGAAAVIAKPATGTATIGTPTEIK